MLWYIRENGQTPGVLLGAEQLLGAQGLERDVGKVLANCDLAERCKQSVKMALAKCALGEGSMLRWDEQLQWITLGYRFSRQETSGYSLPADEYDGEPACVPPAVGDRYRPGLALSFDAPEHQQQAANYTLMRAELLQRNVWVCPKC